MKANLHTALRPKLRRRTTWKAANRQYLPLKIFYDTSVRRRARLHRSTTSTLQQEAARKLGFTVAQTMMVAQQLYESGRITYMRTDSVNLSELAINGSKAVQYDGRQICTSTPLQHQDQRSTKRMRLSVPHIWRMHR